MENQDQDTGSHETHEECYPRCPVFVAEYIAFKKMIIERSEQFERAEAMTKEIEEKEKEVLELEEKMKTLQEKSVKMQHDRCAVLEKLEPIRKELENWCMERDKCQKETEKKEAELLGLQATLKQFQDLMEVEVAAAHNAVSLFKSKYEGLLAEVSKLEESRKLVLQQVEEQRRIRKKASDWLKAAEKLARNATVPARLPDDSALLQSGNGKQQLQKYSASNLRAVCDPDEDGEEVTQEQLYAMIAEMKIPRMLSPIPPSPSEPRDNFAQASQELLAAPPEQEETTFKMPSACGAAGATKGELLGQASQGYRTNVSWNREEHSAQVVIDWLQDMPCTSSRVPVVDVLVTLADKNVQFTFRDEPLSRFCQDAGTMPLRGSCRFKVSSAGLIEQVQAQRIVCVDREVQTDNVQCSPPREGPSVGTNQLALHKQDNAQFLQQAATITVERAAEKGDPAEEGAELG